jgi:hypothetical protein
MFLSFPMFYHRFARMSGRLFTHPVSDRQVLVLAVGQTLVMFGVALICALVGLLYAHRLALPGLGRTEGLKRWALLCFVAGLALTPLDYFGLERGQMERLPELFPRPWWWALASVAGSAVGQEVVMRFGLVTICVYLLRWRGFKGHPWPATAAVSVFMSVGQLLMWRRFHFFEEFAAWQAGAYSVAFLVFQALLAEVYLRRGLWFALVLNSGLGVRIIIYSFIVPPAP